MNNNALIKKKIVFLREEINEVMKENTIRLICKNNGMEYDVPQNYNLADVYNMTGLSKGHEKEPWHNPVCARVNNKVEGMHYRLYKPKVVEFLDITSESGMRCYTRTLFFVLCKAVHDLYPEAGVVINIPVSNGYYCEIERKSSDTENAIDTTAIRERMQEIIHEGLKIRRHEVLTEEAIKMFRQMGDNSKAELLDGLGRLYTLYYEIDGYMDYYYGALLTNTSQLYLFGLETMYDGMLLRLPTPSNPAKLGAMIKQDKMFEMFQDHHHLQRILGISTIGQFNEAIKTGYGRNIIQVSEALQEKRIAEIAYRIASKARIDDGRQRNDSLKAWEQQQKRVRMVLIAGPSSSGKTTTCKRLCIQLLANGIKPVPLSLDDYFVDREKTPCDETGDYDFESLYALNLPLLNDHLQRLFRGETVEMPRYDFPTGKSVLSGRELRLQENEVLVVEGIHALNPELTAQIPEDMKYRIYASALTTILLDTHNYIPTTDNRLLRRIVRDYKYRGCSAQETIRRWPSVRRGENKWIFPYQENADVMFNTAMLYELAVIKQQAEPVLEEVPENCEEYAEAYRLRKFLHYIKPLSDDSLPPTSLLREFLGGSSFAY